MLFTDKTLDAFNIEHVQGTLGDFVKWLQKEFPDPLKPITLNAARNPAAAAFLELSAGKQKEAMEVLGAVEPVDRNTLNTAYFKEETGEREYYKGFKPDWFDIIHEIPAKTHYLADFQTHYQKARKNDENLVMIVGPAGSGKTTILMQAAFALSTESTPVYFLKNSGIM